MPIIRAQDNTIILHYNNWLFVMFWTAICRYLLHDFLSHDIFPIHKKNILNKIIFYIQVWVNINCHLCFVSFDFIILCVHPFLVLMFLTNRRFLWYSLKSRFMNLTRLFWLYTQYACLRFLIVSLLLCYTCQVSI